MSLSHLILLLAAWLIVGAHASRNITVDDTDSSIVYTSRWGPSTPNSLDIGGSHKLTEYPNEKATFIFTGIAIYFYSPLWPYLVNTAISLDGASSTLVDLQDHSRPTDNGSDVSETVQSALVWGSSGLANTQHTLVMSVGAGQPYAVVDALMYTVLDSSDLSSSSLSTTTYSTSIFTSFPTSSQSIATTVQISPSESAATSSRSTKSSVLPIALGAALGALAIILAIVLFWVCLHKRKTAGPGTTAKLWTAEGPFPPQDRTIQSHSLPVAGLPMRGSVYSDRDYPHEQGYIPGQGELDVHAREPAVFGYTPIPTMAGIGSGVAAHSYGGPVAGGYNPYDQSQWIGEAAGAAVRPKPTQPESVLTQNRPFRQIDTPSLPPIDQSRTTASNLPFSEKRALHLANTNSSMSYPSDLGAYYQGSIADGSERMSSSMTSASRPESSFTLPLVDSLGKKREIGNDEHSISTGQTSYNQHCYDQKDASLRQIHEDESLQAHLRPLELEDYRYPYARSSAGESQSGSKLEGAHPPAYTPT